MRVILGSMIVIGALATAASADDGSVVIEKGRKVTAKVAAKEVKTTSTKNAAKGTRRAPPPEKAEGGTLVSGPNSCDVHIDNRTALKIQIFIDGDFEGMVGPWGDAVRYDVLSGRTKLYARAEFTDGSVFTWGPKHFNCSAYSTYTWRLDE